MKAKKMLVIVFLVKQQNSVVLKRCKKLFMKVKVIPAIDVIIKQQ